MTRAATAPRPAVALVALWLALTAAVAATPPVVRADASGDPLPFTDIGTSSFQVQILWLRDAGITGGCTATTFCPKATVTRGQMAAFLARALNLPSASGDHFTDDETSTFESSINRVFEAGITGGCTTTTFCPTSVVTREQMAAFLSRALELPAATGNHFTDDDGRPLEEHINRLRDSGITGGCTATTFCPKAGVTREQMAAFLYRALFLEDLPENFTTAAAGAAHYLSGQRTHPTPVQCSDPTINCPGGMPLTAPPTMTTSASALQVIDSDPTFPFSATLVVQTDDPMIVNVPLAGDCNLSIDTTAGAAETVQVSGSMSFVDLPPHNRVNALVFNNVDVTGLTEDDIEISGSFACALADFGLGFIIDTLEAAITDMLRPLCGVYGPELFVACPIP